MKLPRVAQAPRNEEGDKSLSYDHGRKANMSFRDIRSFVGDYLVLYIVVVVVHLVNFSTLSLTYQDAAVYAVATLLIKAVLHMFLSHPSFESKARDAVSVPTALAITRMTGLYFVIFIWTGTSRYLVNYSFAVRDILPVFRDTTKSTPEILVVGFFVFLFTYKLRTRMSPQ